MLAITEIQAEGEPADGSRRSSGNDGRSRRSTAEAEGSSFSFHRQTISPSASLRRMSAFLSNLVRRMALNSNSKNRL